MQFKLRKERTEDRGRIERGNIYRIRPTLTEHFIATNRTYYLCDY